MKLHLPDFLYFSFISFPSMFMKQDSGLKDAAGVCDVLVAELS